jgi:hypothetical protein
MSNTWGNRWFTRCSRRVSRFRSSYFLYVKLKSSLRKFYGRRHYDLVDRYGVSVSQMTTYSWLITGFVARLTRRVSLVEQELLTLSGHLSSPPGFSGVRVTRSLVLYVCFVDRCLSFCTFSFGHCVVCSSSIYRFWLPLWYLQTLLITNNLAYYASSIFRNLTKEGATIYVAFWIYCLILWF